MKVIIVKLSILFSFILFLSINSCDQTTENEKPENRDPLSPVLSIPDNKAENVELAISLSWQASTDPDGNKVTYNVYIDTNTTPGQVASSGQTATSYHPTLNTSTTYYWKVEVNDGNGGKAESAIWSFTTLNSGPSAVILNNPANEITDVALDAKLIWEASSDPDGDDITYDVYFGTETIPANIASSAQSDTTYQPTLTENTTYYWKVVAKDVNSETAESATWSFTTLKSSLPINYDSITDARDGKVYKTIIIDNQTWLAENLAYLPDVHIPSNTSSTEARYYVYGYDGTATESARISAPIDDAKANGNYSTYGVLYNWYAAMDGAPKSNDNPSGVQGVCPAGWHLPSKAEWSVLEAYIIQDVGEDVATALKSTSGWDEDGNGTDLYGLSFLPGGALTPNFTQEGLRGYWWTTNGYFEDVWYKEISYQSPYLREGVAYKIYAMSVRCIMD